MKDALNETPSQPVGEFETNRDPVEVLAEEFLQRRRRGEEVDVSEYTEKHPQLSRRIRELFSTLLLVEETKAVKRQSTSNAENERRGTLPESELVRLGDFHVVRVIGRGGMGVVYEARQESLGRRVALKVMSPRSLPSPKSLERFRREAHAAARLHHTNIVPVFGVGEEDGKHYYVMQYIEGYSLDNMVEGLLDTVQELRTAGAEADVRNPDQTITTTVQDPKHPDEPWVVTTYKKIDESKEAFIKRHQEMVEAVREALR